MIYFRFATIGKNNQMTDARPDRKTRIARRVMPFITADSALLPTDKWIFSTLRDMYKTVPVFRRDVNAVGAVAGFVGGVTAALGAGAVVLSTIGALLPGVIVAGVMAVALTGGAVYLQARDIWQRAKNETLPRLKEEIGRRYVTYKADEVLRVWKERLKTKKAGAEPPATLPPSGGLKVTFVKSKNDSPAQAGNPASADRPRRPR